MRRSLAFASAAVAACAAAAPLHAQGSSLDQHSACMSGRIGAGAASPCDDGSAVFFSPAALARQSSALALNLTIVRSSNEFTYDADVPNRVFERETETVPVPAAFLNWRVNDRLAVGIGAFAPYGLGLKWPACSVDEINGETCQAENNFEGRFTGYDNALRSYYIQPTVAYQVIPGTLSLGVGLDYVIGTIDVHQRVAGPAAQGLGRTDIADAFLSGSGSGVTGHIGALLDLSPRTSIAARYLHSVEVDLDGDAEFEQALTGIPGIDASVATQFGAGGPLENQSVATTIEFPWHYVVGVSHRPTEALNLMFDFQRTGWSTFDAFQLEFGNGGVDTLKLNYEDANTFRFAAEFDATDALQLRAGFRYNTEATPRATPFLPEGERNYYTVGLGYRVTPRLAADFAFQYIDQPDRRGALLPEGPLEGVYSTKGQVFGITLSYRFGRHGQQDGM